jgi:hypothetical protein
MSMMPQYAPSGALCAAHPDRVADSVCVRCGNFSCAECSESRAQQLCPTCRETIGSFPYSRDNFDFSRVWNFSFEAWRRELTMLGVCAFICVLLGSAGSLVSNGFTQPAMMSLQKQGESANFGGAAALLIAGFLIGTVVNLVVQGIGIMGLIRVALDTLHGRKPDINRMFSQMKKLGRYVQVQAIILFGLGGPAVLGAGVLFGAAVLVGGGSLTSFKGIERAFNGPAPFLVIGLGFLLLLVVFVYLSLPLTFAPWELIYSDCSAMESLRRAWTLGDGFRAETFGYSFVVALASFGIIIAGFLALCVGAIVAVPIAMALQHLVVGGLYLSLRNGSNLPAPTEA